MENELVQPEQEEVFIAPDSESEAPTETVEEEETPVEAAAEVEEEKQPEPEEQEVAPVDEAPEVTPDTKLASALEKLEKLEKRLAYEQRQREKREREEARRNTLPEQEDVAAPKQDDFETYDEYQEAVIDYKVQKGISNYQQKVQQQANEGSLEGFINETTTSGREMYSDFDDVVLRNEVPITKPMLEIMQNCDNPESIAYFLGKNIKDATAISRMSPVQAARAIGIIETRVASELSSNPTGKATPAKPNKKVSAAPEPVKPTGSTQVIEKDPEKMTQQEYEAWRRNQGARF